MPSHVCWLGWFAIRPQFRRKGLGSAAIHAISRIVRSAGSTELWVYTGCKDEIARMCYMSLGFQVLGPASDYAPGKTAEDSDIVLKLQLEISWALHQSKRTDSVPALRIYRNRTLPNFPLEPEDSYERLIEQWRLLKGFFSRWERDTEGNLVAAFNNYKTLDEFEDLFRAHFQDYLVSKLDQETARRMLTRKKKRWDEL